MQLFVFENSLKYLLFPVAKKVVFTVQGRPSLLLFNHTYDLNRQFSERSR